MVLIALETCEAHRALVTRFTFVGKNARPIARETRSGRMGRRMFTVSDLSNISMLTPHTHYTCAAVGKVLFRCCQCCRTQ